MLESCCFDTPTPVSPASPLPWLPQLMRLGAGEGEWLPSLSSLEGGDGGFVGCAPPPPGCKYHGFRNISPKNEKCG